MIAARDQTSLEPVYHRSPIKKNPLSVRELLYYNSILDKMAALRRLFKKSI